MADVCHAWAHGGAGGAPSSLLCLRASRGTVTVQAVYYNDGQTSTSVVCVALTTLIVSSAVPGSGARHVWGRECALYARCFVTESGGRARSVEQHQQQQRILVACVIQQTVSATMVGHTLRRPASIGIPSEDRGEEQEALMLGGLNLGIGVWSLEVCASC